MNTIEGSIEYNWRKAWIQLKKALNTIEESLECKWRKSWIQLKKGLNTIEEVVNTIEESREYNWRKDWIQLKKGLNTYIEDDTADISSAAELIMIILYFTLTYLPEESFITITACFTGWFD